MQLMNDSRGWLKPSQYSLSDPDHLRDRLLQEFEQPKPDFSGLQNMIKMPPLVKMKPQNNPLKKPETELVEVSFLSRQLKKNVIEQRQLLMEEFQTFQTPENFQFHFPESKFPTLPPNQSNKISYQKPFITEIQNTYRDKLSPQQIAQIRETGQFAVKSSRQWVKIPYIWKMNQTMFKGIENLQNDWNKRLGTVVGVFQDIWEMLTVDLPEQLAHIGKFPWRIITLIFGKKEMNTSHVVNYEREVAKDFWHQVMTKHYVVSREWGSDLWNFLDSQFRASAFEEVTFNSDLLQLENPAYSMLLNRLQFKRLQKQKADELAAFQSRKQISTEKANKLTEISSKFSDHWDKVSKKIFIQISNSVQQKHSDEKNKELQRNQSEQRKKADITAEEVQVLERFQEEQFTYYLNFLKKEFTVNQVPINVIEAIVTLLMLMHITRKKENLWRQQLNSRKAQLENRIRTENPIRSRNYTWFHQKVKKTFQPIEQQLRQQFDRSLLTEQFSFNQTQLDALKLWVDYTRTFEQRKQQKQQEKQNFYEPVKSFTLTYRLLPPYNVIRHAPDLNNNDQTYYVLEKQREISVATAHCGWKFILYCNKLKVWAINAFVILVYMCWIGPFGLRRLCGIDRFTYDQFVDPHTGQVTDFAQLTVLGRFILVLEGIIQSRSYFEAQPDTGIFGKVCSRICNLFECYVFRFLIAGVLLVLTLYPIAIFIVSALSFLLLITIWAWVPLAIIVTYFFSLFIYNLDSTDRYSQCYQNLFPLPVLIFGWIFSIIKVFFYFSSFFVFMPILNMLIIIYACICRCMRSVSDCVVLGFLRCCGHIPSTNSMFATKISGADMAAQLFMSVNEEDVYYLIQAQLQQIHLNQVEKIIRENIQKPLQRYKKIMRLIVSPLLQWQSSSYGSSIDSYLFGNIHSHPITKSVEFTKQLASKQLTQHRKRYPKRPSNIRFTQQELNLYFDNTISMVKTYVTKQNLSKWIFALFDLKEGCYQELTRKVWIDVFQCGEQIFEPLESIEQRFKLEDQYQDSYGYSYSTLRVDVSKVVNAIRGETDLKAHKMPIINPINTSLFNRRYQIIKVRELLDMAAPNSDINVSFNKKTPCFIFAPHLSIKELIKYDDTNYTKLKQENQKKAQKW